MNPFFWLHQLLGVPTVDIEAVASVSLISAISLFGVAMTRDIAKIKFYLVSLAAGAMLGNALVDLIPESFSKPEHSLSASFFIVVGFMVCFLFEKVLKLTCHHGAGAHCAGEEHHDDDHGHGHIHPTGWMAMISHGMDNFTDGALVGITYLISPATGLITTMCIILHEIPMEFGGFGVLVNAGFKRLTAVGVNFMSGVVAICATILTLWLGSTVSGFSEVLTPIGAGAVLYITASGLIPQLQSETSSRRSAVQLGIMSLGLGALFFAKWCELHFGL